MYFERDCNLTNVLPTATCDGSSYSIRVLGRHGGRQIHGPCPLQPSRPSLEPLPTLVPGTWQDACFAVAEDADTALWREMAKWQEWI